MVPWDSWDPFEEFDGMTEPRLSKRDWDEIDDYCYEQATPIERKSSIYDGARARDLARKKNAARLRYARYTFREDEARRRAKEAAEVAQEKEEGQQSE
jgi:hypothetical protein